MANVNGAWEMSRMANVTQVSKRLAPFFLDIMTWETIITFLRGCNCLLLSLMAMMMFGKISHNPDKTRDFCLLLYDK